MYSFHLPVLVHCHPVAVANVIEVKESSCRSTIRNERISAPETVEDVFSQQLHGDVELNPGPKLRHNAAGDS